MERTPPSPRYERVSPQPNPRPPRFRHEGERQTPPDSAELVAVEGQQVVVDPEAVAEAVAERQG